MLGVAVSALRGLPVLLYPGPGTVVTIHCPVHLFRVLLIVTALGIGRARDSPGCDRPVPRGMLGTCRCCCRSMSGCLRTCRGTARPFTRVSGRSRLPGRR